MKHGLIYTSLLALCLSAQSTGQVLLSGEQEFIYKAVDSALFIVRQDYTLQSKGESPVNYGRDGNPYFGRQYALGIFSNGQLWCNADILQPWESDPNFKEYREADSLRPLNTGTGIRHFHGGSYQMLTLDTGDGDSSSTGRKKLCSFTIPGDYPEISSTYGVDTGGWLVLAYTKTTFSDNDTMPVQLSIYKVKPELQGSEGLIKAPRITDNLIGGFYVTPRFSTGKIELSVSGILVKKLVSWYLAPIPQVKATHNQLVPIDDEPSKKRRRRG